MSDLPEGWVEATLGEIAAAMNDGPFGSNLKTSHYTDDGPRVIRLQNIGDGVFVDEEAHISKEHYQALLKHAVEAGDIVIASLGPELPRSCIVPLHVPPAIVKADCIRVRPVPSVSARFVSHFLNSPVCRNRTSSLVHGVGRPRLNLRELRTLPVAIAPTCEQERVVAAIEEQFSRLDAAEEALHRARCNLERFRGSVLDCALAAEWPRTTLGEVASIVSGPAFSSQFFGELGDGIPLLRGENIEPGGLRWKDVKTWPEDQLAGYEHLFVLESDLILAMDRPVISTGLKLAPVRADDLPALLVQRVARIRPTNLVEAGFLHTALRHSSFVPHVLADQTGTQLPHITLRGIRSYPVPLPPLVEQRRIVAEVERQLSIVDAMGLAIDSALARSARLRRSILECAFRGTLVPQDPSDEPAPVLLARIEAERAGAEGKRRSATRN